MNKIMTIAIVFFAGIILSGCMGKSHNDKTFDELAYGRESSLDLNSEQHEQLGDGYLRRGKPEMALIHFNKAIELDQTNLDARLKRGDLLVAQGLDEQALGEFNKVLEKDPDHAIANQAAGGVYFRVGLYTEARTHLTRAVDKNPMLWKAHNYLGILCDREGDYDRAVTHFNRALDLHQGSGSDEIYNNLGVVHIARQEYLKAVEAFRQALKSGGLTSRTYNNLGLALARLDRLDEALESFKYAGGEARAHNNLGYVLLTDNQPARAVPYFEKAIELSPSYYVKAADNLKRARLASRFMSPSDRAQARNDKSGSTPNPLLHPSFPDGKQNPGGPATSPASAGSPTPVSGEIQKISFSPEPSGVSDTSDNDKSYGLHVASFRVHDRAFAQCAALRRQGFTTWINQVDLGDKGIWYRVLVGDFATIAEAQQHRPDVLAVLSLDRAPVYQRVVPRIDGSHL